MKISLIIYELDVRGGTQKQFLRLCQYLSDKKIDFEIVTKYYDAENTYDEFRTFKIKSLFENKKDSGRPLSLVNLYKLYKLIDKRSSIVNIHDLPQPKLISLVKLFSKRKVVWQLNDMPSFYHEGVSHGKGDSWKSKLGRLVFNWLIKMNFYDTITVNVTKNASRVKRHLNREAKVFYCGVDQYGDSFSQHENIINYPKIRLLTTGVFFPYRNYEVLVETVRFLRGNGLDVELNIIGSTELNKEYANKIQSMIVSYQLDKYVTVKGQLNEEDYKQVYNNSDIFLFLNIDQSWGLAVFEAMSIGMPVIVSNSVGATELLTHQVDSYIVNPRDVQEISRYIITLIENEEAYRKISTNGKSRVEELTWEKTYCRDMLELFRDLTVKSK